MPKIYQEPNGARKGPILKNINTVEQLEEAFYKCTILSPTGDVLAETDMRAHANPTRMQNIKGLPCSHCALPSVMILKQVYTCQKCNHTEERPGPNGDYANPRYCHYCKP